MPGKRTSFPTANYGVRDLLDALEADYRLREAKSLPQITAHLKPVREILGRCRAQDLTPEVVDKYIEARLRGNPEAEVKAKAKGTVNRETTLLGRAFRLAISFPIRTVISLTEKQGMSNPPCFGEKKAEYIAEIPYFCVLYKP